MVKRPRWWRLVAAGAAASIALAGCGVSSSGSALGTASGGVSVSAGRFGGADGAALLGRAAQDTAAAKTQKVAMDITIEGVPMVGDVTMTSIGQFDNEHGRAQLSMDMGDVFGLIGADAGLPDDAGTIETVVDGDVVYMRSPLIARLGDTDKPWLRIDAGDLDQAGALAGGAQSDPGGFLEFLRSAGTVEELGTEDVRGVSTTHVRVELELAELISDADAAERERLEQTLESLGATGDTFETVPAEAWVDGEGRVRKFSLTMDFAAAEQTAQLGEVKVTVTTEFFDFGEPVDITIPDPADVGELDPSTFLLGN